MAFPNIDVNKPLGTYRISTIDDYERETRRWLRACMMEISGYPDSSALKIAVWTTATRPQNPTQGMFGYNTTIGALEYFDGTDWIPMTVVLPDVYDKARKDQYGNVIDTTYATKVELTNLANSIPSISVMVGATASRAGESGLVPQPAAGKQNHFLRGDGTWASPDQVTYGVGTAALLNDGTDTENRLWSAKALVDALGGAKQISANGYINLGGGLVFQWGKKNVTNAHGIDGCGIVTFPYPYTTAVYSVNFTPYGWDYDPESYSNADHSVRTDTQNSSHDPQIYDKLTGFEFHCGGAAGSIYWMALGK